MNNQKNIAAQLYEIGKLPPQAVELEEAVIGALMIERDAITMIPFLLPEMMYKESHALILRAIFSLIEKQNPVDILTVTNELKTKGNLDIVGGAYYISQLTNRVASAANVEFHSRVIQQKYLQREVITQCGELIKFAYEDTCDALQLLERFANVATTLQMRTNTGREVSHISPILDEEKKDFLARLEAAQNGTTVGIDTGLLELNHIGGGWQDSDLVIVAARPSMGKTAFALGTAKAAAQYKERKPIAIFSLEMSSIQLAQRLLISDSEISGMRYKNGTLGNGEINSLYETREQLRKLGIYIDDTPAISITELKTKARRLKQQHNISLIVVDYLQLMTVTDNRNSNREQEVSTISRNLKALAKELNVPVIALSQLSRECEKRADKRPILSDLRESGAIEQDADIVIFIHRPEYYGFTQDGDGESLLGIAEMIYAKHRNGPVGTRKVKFNEGLAKFYNLESILPTIDPNTPVINPYEVEKGDDLPF